MDVLRERLRGWRGGLSNAEIDAAENGRTRLAAAQASDVADWLPNDLLTKLDRCLMAHAVEGRTPFLDRGIARAAFRLPDGLKVRQGLGKWILRRWLEKHLPAAAPWAPKQGFSVPVGAWIGGKGAQLGPLVAHQPSVAEIAVPEKVVSLFRRAGEDGAKAAAAWRLLFYALWHRRHVQGFLPVGDVMTTLAAR